MVRYVMISMRYSVIFVIFYPIHEINGDKNYCLIERFINKLINTIFDFFLLLDFRITFLIPN